MEIGVNVVGVTKCAVKNNCLFCCYYQVESTCEELHDIVDGMIDTKFDYEKEKECCDLAFWKVLGVDKKMQQLFENDMLKDVVLANDQSDWEAYKYFIKKY